MEKIQKAEKKELELNEKIIEREHQEQAVHNAIKAEKDKKEKQKQEQQEKQEKEE